jgi:hypothetical protein
VINMLGPAVMSTFLEQNSGTLEDEAWNFVKSECQPAPPARGSGLRRAG